MSMLRKNRLRFSSLEEESAAASDTADLELLQKERNRQLYDALEQLPPDYRQGLYLLYFEEMSHEEAARVMKKTRKQIYNLAARGKKALRETLEGMGFENA